VLPGAELLRLPRERRALARRAARLADSGWDTCFVLNQERVVLGRIGRRAIRGREDVTAEEAMTAGPSTIRPSARLRHTVERMQRQKLTNLPVTTPDGRLVGLLSRGDAEQALAAVNKS